MQSAVVWTWGLLLLLTIHSVSPSEFADYTCPKKCHCFSTTIGLHSNIKLKCESLKKAHKFVSSVEQANRVVSLQATNANISKIDSVYSNCINLKKLDLSVNTISSLKNFPSFPKLMDLNLNGNKISKLNEFSLPKSLVHVNFSHNLISELPIDITKLTSLKSFDITDNLIDCNDCDTLLVRDWLIKNDIEGHSNVKCHFPRSLHNLLWSEVKRSSVCKSRFDTRHRRTIIDDVYHDDILDGSGDNANERVHLSLPGQGIEFDEPEDNDHDLESFIPFNPSTSEPTPVENEIIDDDFHFEDFNETLTETKTEENINFSEIIDDGSGSGDDSISIGQTLTSTEYFGSGDVSLSTTESSVITTTEEDIGSGLPYSIDDNDSEYGDVENDTDFGNDTISHRNLNDNGTEEGEDIFTTTIVSIVSLQPVTEIIRKHPGVSKTKFGKIFEPEKPEEQEEQDNESTTVISDNSAVAVEQDTNKQPLGTYIFLAILIAVLICLMGYAVIKSNLRNRKRKRSSDAEKPEVEMADMTKTPLVLNDGGDSVKINGKPETIPLTVSDEPLEKLADEPEHLGQEVANELSLSPTNGITTATPLTPETERVKIRVSELPDSMPKTPVLVTRTRSNAGDFIVTPNEKVLSQK